MSLLSWLGAACWLIAAGGTVAGVAPEGLAVDPAAARGLDDYRPALTWATVSAAVACVLVIAAAAEYRRSSGPSRVDVNGTDGHPGDAPGRQAPVTSPPGRVSWPAAIVVIGAGVVLTAVAWLLPWQFRQRFAGDSDADAAWQSFAVLGHALVLAALVLLAMSLLGTAERWLYWWLALSVGGIGLAVYWAAAPFDEAAQTDTQIWLGPGVPTATLGFLAIAAGAALPLRPAVAGAGPGTATGAGAGGAYPRGAVGADAIRPAVPATSAPRNGPGRLGLIFGVGAILVSWCFVLGLPVGVTAVVLGLRGRLLVTRGLASNRRQAWAALILGGITLGLSLAYSAAILLR